MVARLALVPGVLQQRNAGRDTPLPLARRLRRWDAADILQWAEGVGGGAPRPPGPRAAPPQGQLKSAD